MAEETKTISTAEEVLEATFEEPRGITLEETAKLVGEGFSELQGELELPGAGRVKIPAVRYDELLRAEHTVGLLRKVFTDKKAFEYNHEREAAIKFLLGLGAGNE